MMEEIRFRHDKESIKHLFSQLVHLYTIYIYNFFIVWICMTKLTDEFHAPWKYGCFLPVGKSPHHSYGKSPLRFPNAPVMWIPETRKAYHQQTPEGDDGFVRGWDVDFWPEKSRRKKKTGTSPIYIDPARSSTIFCGGFFVSENVKIDKNWIIICKVWSSIPTGDCLKKLQTSSLECCINSVPLAATSVLCHLHWACHKNHPLTRTSRCSAEHGWQILCFSACMLSTPLESQLLHSESNHEMMHSML